MTTGLFRKMEWQTSELSRVSWHMLENQESTARRFSHELHDELGQSLTALKANVISLGRPENSERPRPAIASDLVDGAIRNVRELVATAAADHPGRLRTGCQPALALREVHRADRHRGGLRLGLLRPLAGRNRDAPVPHRPGGADQRRAALASAKRVQIELHANQLAGQALHRRQWSRDWSGRRWRDRTEAWV